MVYKLVAVLSSPSAAQVTICRMMERSQFDSARSVSDLRRDGSGRSQLVSTKAAYLRKERLPWLLCWQEVFRL